MNHAVITGGKGGLAQAIVRAFTTPATPAWLVAAPARAELDVADLAAIQTYFRDRPVDLLICNAAITRDALLSRLESETWDEVLRVNFHGAAACAEHVLPGMLRKKSGHILFISSHSALHPPAGQAAYAAAKAGLLGLTRDLARAHGAANVRVNAILPGFLETKMTATVSEKRRAEVRADHSLGRFNTAAHVAAFIRFLHEQMPHTSGQVFQLDSR